MVVLLTMPSKFTLTQCTVESELGFVVGVLKRNRSLVEDDSESVGSNNEICFKKHRAKMPRDKVVWTRDLESHFISLCNHARINGLLLTSSFTSAVYQDLALSMNVIAKQPPNYFTEANLRTKWKNLKVSWKVLYGFKTNLGSGMAWDNDIGTIAGDQSVLEELYAKSRDVKQILKHGLPHFEMCTELFKNSVATGAYTRSSQSNVPNNDTPDDNSIPASYPFDDSMPSPMSQSVPDTGGSSGSSSRKRRSFGADSDRAMLKRGLNSFTSYLDKKMSSANTCMDMVQKIEGISTSLVLKAARRFEDVEVRNVFLSLSDANKVAWVSGLANEH